MKEGAKIVTPLENIYTIAVKAVFIIGAAYGAYSFIFNLGASKAGQQIETKQINNKLESVIGFQIRDSIYRTYETKKVDSLVAVFGIGMKQIGQIKTSQDSLKAYYIRKAVTKQDLQEVLRIFDTEKKRIPNDKVKHGFSIQKK